MNHIEEPKNPISDVDIVRLATTPYRSSVNEKILLGNVEFPPEPKSKLTGTTTTAINTTGANYFIELNFLKTKICETFAVPPSAVKGVLPPVLAPSRWYASSTFELRPARGIYRGYYLQQTTAWLVDYVIPLALTGNPLDISKTIQKCFDSISAIDNLGTDILYQATRSLFQRDYSEEEFDIVAEIMHLVVMQMSPADVKRHLADYADCCQLAISDAKHRFYRQRVVGLPWA